MDEKHNFYNTFEDMATSHFQCFLCGENLNDKNVSKEHIIPKWVQNKFSLWNQTMVLPNQTTIKYKNLTVPCCKNCNNIILSQIENQFISAVETGIDAIRQLNELLIVQWIVKIKFALLFKNLVLKIDRTDPNSKTIVNDEVIKSFDITHTLLQTIRFPTNFIGPKPWSLFIYDIHDNDNTYYMGDYLESDLIYFQLGNIGLILVLLDCGINIDMFNDVYGIFSNQIIHEVQFREICAKIHYKQHTKIKEPYYTIRMPNENLQTMDFITTESYGNTFEGWSQETYAHFLHHHLRKWAIPYDELYHGGDLVSSYLKTDDGKFRIYRSSDPTDFYGI
ncbi:hypothetical protein [Vallitalea guaymasensis]|uniref:HNH endonuclease n=1 Tax=Vallitalea guaymasensis TaxID=1185412 RepID=A0A8J8M754_9FIRM|nr:hypothetical protein [Vallitalea guaymasensis]QUH27571.1 hypothetical protein HYG85_01010 [Vallitalea guaymasensis]